MVERLYQYAVLADGNGPAQAQKFTSGQMTDQVYIDKLSQVLSILLASGTHITVGQTSMDEARQAWCKILQPVIPLKHLESAVLDAHREKCSTTSTKLAGAAHFLSAGDVIRHWRATKADAAEKNRVERSLAPRTCQHCKGTLKIKVYDSETASDVEIECPAHTKK